MLIALLSLPCQRTPRKSSENIAMLCSTTEPLLHVPEALELGTPCYKLVGPNGVHYRGIPLCIYHKGFFIKYLDRFAWGRTDSVGELSSLEVAQRFLEGKRGLHKWQEWEERCREDRGWERGGSGYKATKLSTHLFCLSADRMTVLSHGFGAAFDIRSPFSHEEASVINPRLNRPRSVGSLLSGLDSLTMTGLTPTLS